ncbi:peptidoglycan-binding protein [Naumannella sp. ID2617S]|nr:peptidoglycan-binding protein [Naumannella sp. ID2617S]
MITRRIVAATAAVATGLTALTGIGVGVATSTAAPSSASCTVSDTPTLKQGSQGTAVKTLQCILKNQGAPLVGTGYFGPKTKAAVLDFQRAKGLEADAIVGPKTWAALQAANGGGTATPPPSSGNVSAARQRTLDRAKTWLTAYNGGPVPYSQQKYFQGYRQDCSGYASMALEFKDSPYTVLLASSTYSRKISMAELKPGDLVIDIKGDNNTRHVVIFEKWDNAQKTSYTAYEQTGDGDRTRHRSLTYGLGSGSEYDAYRPKKYGD